MSERLETGLRHRLKRAGRQMSEQHRHLRPLFEALSRALSNGVREDAEHQLARYREALQAHFQLEGEMFFPAVHGLHPELAGELEALDAEHRVLEDHLTEVAGLVTAGSDGRAALQRFLDVLIEHERREERLMTRVDVNGGA